MQEWVGDDVKLSSNRNYLMNFFEDCDTTCFHCPDFWDGDKFDGGDCEEERSIC